MRFFFTVFFILTACISSYGQYQYSSPISSAGFGELYPFATSVGLSSGALYTFDSPYFINITNPATQASLLYPNFQIDVQAQHRNYSENNLSEQAGDGFFRNAALAFPINKGKWGASVNLAPISRVSYDVSYLGNVDDLGTLTYQYEGKGGINALTVGNGFKLFSDSAKIYKEGDKDSTKIESTTLLGGVNIYYLFGQIQKSKRIDAGGSPGVLNSLLIDDHFFRGIGADVALHFKQHLGKNRFLQLGAVFTAPSFLQGQSTVLGRNYTGSTGVQIFKDTSQYIESTTNYSMPFRLGIGASYKQERILVEANYTFQNWNSIETPFVDQMQMSYDARVGFIYFGKIEANKNWLNQLDYRIGLRTGRSDKTFSSNSIQLYSVNLGIGIPLPISFSRSSINIGGSIGAMSDESNVMNQTFFNGFVGLVFTPDFGDRWFVPSRIY